MQLKFVFLLILLLGQGCNFKKSELKEVFSFPELMGFKEGKGIDIFSSDDDEYLTSIEVDNAGNVYALGHVKSASRLDTDLFLVKIDFAGKLIWKLILDSKYSQILDNSGNESSYSLHLDEKNKVLYLAGVTTGSLIESNSSGGSDLFIAKVTTTGALLWVKHLGEETQEVFKNKLGNSNLDWSKDEVVGQLRLHSSNKLLMTFSSLGNFFEINGGVSTNDIGIMSIDPDSGEIIKGLQLGTDTMTTWGSSHGTTTNASRNETISQSSFDFDGNKVVIPLRTTGSLADTNINSSADAGYFVVDLNLDLITVKQIGSSTYAEWVSQGNYQGVTSGDDQFRSVVVLSSGDYLFYGKSTNSMGGPNQGTDYIFARFVDDKLVRITQSQFLGNDEPRHMTRSSNGDIYCAGHVRTSIFDDAGGILKPIVFRISENGEVLSGYQMGQANADRLNLLDNNYNLVVSQGFQVKRGNIYFGFNNRPTGSSGATDSYLWTIPLRTNQ